MTSTAVEIVMIEDDEGHALLIERNIRRAGINNSITHCANGASALNYLLGADGAGTLHKGRALLVLLDLNLPDMMGYDVLELIKKHDVLRRMPVVILTTTSNSEEINRCYELGCNVYLTKPVNSDSFADAIRQIGLFFSVIQVPRIIT